MTAKLEDLVAELAHATRVPEKALRAAKAHADELAPLIEALARRRITGEWLAPTDDNLLFYGLFVLAAARRRAFWPIWLELVRGPQEAIEGLLGDGAIMSVSAVTLGLVGDAAGDVAALAAHPDTCADARAGLVEALARLMCEGRYPRGDFIALIDALAVIEGTDDDERCRWCVEEAVVLGAIAERLDLLERLWTTPAFADWREVDRADARARLRAAGADPMDLARFDEVFIAAPDDPAKALGWLKRIEAGRPDPAAGVALDWRERAWLAALLKGETMPAGSMNFEAFDGFLHALVIGPDIVLPSEYLCEIWGEGPAFEDEDQLRQVISLMQRHWNAIAARRGAAAAPAIWLETHDDAPSGAHWATGFDKGVKLRASLWAGVAMEEGAELALASISALAGEPLEDWERGELLDALPEHVAALTEFWRMTPARREPFRAQKVGRNEPCPCGSGKKWKKCCGAGPPPMLH